MLSGQPYTCLVKMPYLCVAFRWFVRNDVGSLGQQDMSEDTGSSELALGHREESGPQCPGPVDNCEREGAGPWCWPYFSYSCLTFLPNLRSRKVNSQMGVHAFDR